MDNAIIIKKAAFTHKIMHNNDFYYKVFEIPKNFFQKVLWWGEEQSHGSN